MTRVTTISKAVTNKFKKGDLAQWNAVEHGYIVLVTEDEKDKRFQGVVLQQDNGGTPLATEGTFVADGFRRFIGEVRLEQG